MKDKPRKTESSLKLEMSFDEALMRLVQVDSRELPREKPKKVKARKQAVISHKLRPVSNQKHD